MKLLYFPFLFLVALVLQSTAVPFFIPDGLASGFDIPLAVVIHVAMTRGKSSGMVSGVLLGYLQDAMSGGVLGFNGVSKIIGGFTGGYLKEKFFVRSVGHKLASVAGAVFLALIIKTFVQALFSQPHAPILSGRFLWGIAGNTILTLAVHAFLERTESMFGIRAEEELSLGD